MRPLSAQLILEVWERGEGRQPHVQAQVLLSATQPQLALADLETLTLEQRDALLLQAREAPLGFAGEVEVYNPVTDGWSRLPALTQVVDGAAATSLDGTVWVVGLVGPTDHREIVVQACAIASRFFVHRKERIEEPEIEGGGEGKEAG